MDQIDWFSEATLSSETRVMCAGTLAQCVRRWTRLSESEQRDTVIRVGSRTESRKTLTQDQIAALAREPDVLKM